MKKIKEFILKSFNTNNNADDDIGIVLDGLKHLNNASIAVVGNAQSILSKNYGTNIDGHDFIIRMNAGSPIMPDSQGGRTDVLALSMPLSSRDIMSMFGSPQVVWMTPKRKKITPELREIISLYYPELCWSKLHTTLREARPSTGAMVINLLTEYLSPSKLSLFGFDFKKTKTFYLDKDHVGPHNYDLEEVYVTAMVERSRGEIYS
jgi:hypothetical protein